MGWKMFFSNLAKVYSLHYMEIADKRRRWNWIIFTCMIISGTLGIIIGTVSQLLLVMDYNIPKDVLDGPLGILLKSVAILFIGLALMILLHDQPKS